MFSHTGIVIIGVESLERIINSSLQEFYELFLAIKKDHGDSMSLCFDSTAEIITSEPSFIITLSSMTAQARNYQVTAGKFKDKKIYNVEIEILDTFISIYVPRSLIAKFYQWLKYFSGNFLSGVNGETREDRIATIKSKNPNLYQWYLGQSKLSINQVIELVEKTMSQGKIPDFFYEFTADGDLRPINSDLKRGEEIG